MAKLNDNQLEAVNFEFGSLLVVAGAGTGKTSLITERIVNLINNKNVEPQNILAVTFTEKAAREMVERLDEKMPLGYYEPKVCTYHSFCMDVLKEDGHEMGMNTNFKLITDAEQWMLLRKEIYKLNLKELRPKNNPGKYINDLLKLFSKCTDENISSKDLMKYSLSLEDEKEKNFLHFPTIDIRFDANHALAPNPWADKIKRSKQG
jgi:DNA helicase-2/ATP-dependent DNA helicase PcrA